jgi:serine/threonine protein phosphatase 1
MTQIIIGDVHGCSEELEELLAILPIEEGEEVIFAGDLLDKGPDSAGVVRIVRELQARCRVVLVEGNHEDKHRRYRRNLLLRPEVARQMGGAEELAQITSELLPEDVVFLEEAVPFHRFSAGGKDFVVVHGGIPPVLSSLDGKGAFKQICRTRFVSAGSGKMLPLGQECRGVDPFWADVYDGRFGLALFGHQPFPGVRGFAHAVGLDTGCVFGGSLTAALVSKDGTLSFTSVPAHRKWADNYFD